MLVTVERDSDFIRGCCSSVIRLGFLSLSCETAASFFNHVNRRRRKFIRLRRIAYLLSQAFLQHISYRLRCLYLHGVGHVGVGPQGEARVGMAQHAADCSDVHAALQGDGCEGVAQIMKSYPFHADGIQTTGNVYSHVSEGYMDTVAFNFCASLLGSN